MDDKALQIYRKADDLYNQGQYRMAEPYFLQVLEIEPKHLNTLKELGNCYFYEEDHASAEKYYLLAYQINPREKHILYNLGLIAEMKKDYAKAIEYYEKAIKVDPSFELPKVNLKLVKEIHMWLDGDWSSSEPRRWKPGLDWNTEEGATPGSEEIFKPVKPEIKTEAAQPSVEAEAPQTTMTVEEALNELRQLIGLGSVKQEIEELIATLEIQKRRGSNKAKAKHFVFTGNPGTGKTTVARLLANIFNAIGFLPTNKLVEVDRGKMVAQFIGQTAPLVHKACDDAMGGVLFVDEAYALQQGDRDEFGKEAISTLLKRMEDDRGKFVVIAAGYKKEMHDFISVNPGLKSRFTDYIHFEDYDEGELKAIYDLMAKKEEFEYGDGVEDALMKFFEEMCLRKDKNFANARNSRNALEETIENLSMRFYRMKNDGIDLDTLDKKEFSIIQKEDLPLKNRSKKVSIDMALNELNRLVGLKEVKENITTMIHRLEIQKMRGNQSLLSKHFVFRGNPGTGKTTVARLMANIFNAAGLLPTNIIIEVDRAEMVAGYSGQTAPKVEDVCERSMGGVLFIDEAYSLKQSEHDDFGNEAINTLLKRMEDDRGKFVVIASGYNYEMDNFLASNSGLRSRFTEFIDFPDFTAVEMAEIFKIFAEQEGYQLAKGVEKVLEKVFQNVHDNKTVNFGNAREVRQIFNESLNKQASRIIKLKNEGAKESELMKEVDLIKKEDVFLPITMSKPPEMEAKEKKILDKSEENPGQKAAE